MMSAAHVPYEMKYCLCKEAVITTTKLGRLILIELNKEIKTRYEHFRLEI